MAIVDPKLNAIAKRLEELIPLFREYKPEGWIDFRDKELTLGVRFGLYLKDESEPGFIEMKAVFGSEAAARLGASDFFRATGMVAKLEGWGDSVWSVIMSVPESEVNW